MDGQFFRWTREPFQIVPDASVTLLSTSLLLHTMQYSSLPANWWTPGRLVRMRALGALTTAATPGNGTFELRYGTTSNGGTILATSVAIALGANKTSITVLLEAWIRCMTIGASGTFKAAMRVTPEPVSLVIPAANNPIIAPASAIAPVTVDLTAAGGLNFQMKRSGSTAETWINHDLEFEVGV